MPLALYSRLMRFVTADLNDPTIAPNERGVGPRGSSMIVVYQNNPMNMIRHNDIYTQCRKRVMLRYRTPTFVRDFAKIIQMHIFILNLPKNTIALIRHNRHIIRAFGGIIISFDAD